MGPKGLPEPWFYRRGPETRFWPQYPPTQVIAEGDHGHGRGMRKIESESVGAH